MIAGLGSHVHRHAGRCSEGLGVRVQAMAAADSGGGDGVIGWLLVSPM